MKRILLILLFAPIFAQAQFIGVEVCVTTSGRLEVKALNQDMSYFSQEDMSTVADGDCHAIEDFWQQGFYLIARSDVEYFADGMNYLSFTAPKRAYTFCENAAKESCEEGAYFLLYRIKEEE